MPAFKLSKWYLDCLTDSGDASIIYAGTVDWGFIHLSYSSLLESTGNQVREQRSLREYSQPQFKDSSLSWSSQALDVDAVWHSNSVALRETIFQNEHGSVEWHCLMPRAHAKVRDRCGLGYVEHLAMSIPPWRIPIQHLRWGRFTSASDYAVWIDWEGKFSRRIVYLNGDSIRAAVVEDMQMSLGSGGLLAMDHSVILRDGPLGTTALSVIPGVAKTYPARLLQVNECKWRSRARLTRPDGTVAEGWAIHERVSWPK
ncbi:MAG TPA: hypothetical protein VFE61_05440 [Candidatus Sulfotelmatobacter sp.]|nr:hypothetical protein [Candidatus Sulfotelmatobacter sp.]